MRKLNHILFLIIGRQNQYVNNSRINSDIKYTYVLQTIQRQLNKHKFCKLFLTKLDSYNILQ